MQNEKAPEFDPKRPLPSALEVLRAVLLSPRAFYTNFSAGGPVKEPAFFVLLVSAVTGVLSVAVALVSDLLFTGFSAADLGITLLQALAFVLLSPAAVGVAAALYLLSIRTFVGRVAGFREVYRMLAYACGALVLGWIPVAGAFAVTYALLVLMGIGVRFVYRTSFLTALVTALVSFVPLELALIWLRLAAAGMVSP